ncbi:hypothetical protein GIX45_08175 [Erwinia sp. CPCC 100877]|nr:hypothetical protein [Erwinia sp. CPCC 100877]
MNLYYSLSKEMLIDNLMKGLDTENITKTLNFCYGSSGIYFQLKILNEYFIKAYNQVCIPEFILEDIQEKIILNLDMNCFFKEKNASALNIVDGLLSVLVPILFSKKKTIDIKETFIAKMFLID